MDEATSSPALARLRVWAGHLLALACVAALCACSSGPQGADRRPPRPVRLWSAETAEGADRLFVMRAAEETSGRDTLMVVSIDDVAQEPVWTSPAGYDARVLCADASRIAVALSERGGSNLESHRAGNTITGRGKHLDQRVVVLRSDGGITTGSIPSDSTGVVNSGVFVGERLVLGMIGPVLHYPSPSLPFAMEASGTMTPLRLGGERQTDIVFYEVIQLGDTGRFAGLFSGAGPGPAGERVVPMRLEDDALIAEAGGFPRLEDRSFRFAAAPVGGRDGSVLFGPTSRDLTAPIALDAAALAEGTTSRIADSVWTQETLPWTQRCAAPLSDGGYLVCTVGSRFTEDYHRRIEFRLSRLDASSTLSPTPVILRQYPVELRESDRVRGAAMPVAVRQDTWVYVSRFGR